MSAGKAAGDLRSDGCLPADCSFQMCPPATSQHSTNQSVTTPTRWVSHCIQFIQLNLQHNKAASSMLCKQIANIVITVALVREPWINKGKILWLNSRGSTLFWDHKEASPWTGVITKGVDA